MKLASKICMALLMFIGFAHSALARDMTSRLGVGYSNQFGLSEELPSIALRYYPNSSYGLAAALGVDTEDGNSRFGFMGKVMKTIFSEDNLNFYTGVSAGLISQEVAGSTDSGFDLAGFVGSEFFFTGLDSLGFSFEAGVGVTSISSDVRFRTIGDHPLRAGVIFYF